LRCPEPDASARHRHAETHPSVPDRDIPPSRPESTARRPEGTCIYFAVDFDAIAAQIPAVVAYFCSAAQATPAYRTGVYSSYAVVEAVIKAGACSRGWQTYAWSGKKRSAWAHIYQFENDVERNGVGVDLNESYGNEGFWSLREDEEPMLSKETANMIIARWLAHEYDKASDLDKANRRTMADELRVASGQPKQNS